MKKNEAITIIACFSLWLVTLLLQGVDCEFRWMWLQIFTTLALPVVLIFLLFKRIFRIKSIWLKLILFPIYILGVLYLAFLYIWFGTSADAMQYSFHSPINHDEVIVKEYHISLFTGGIDFYKPTLFILKKRVNTEHHETEECLPFASGEYVVKWSDNEEVCEIQWKAGDMSETYDDTETITFN